MVCKLKRHACIVTLEFLRHAELFNAAPPASRISEYIAISNREINVESRCVRVQFGVLLAFVKI
jgi:hypothetical protein